MTVKKDYEIGDSVWIHGVGREKKLTQGTVVKSFKIDQQAFQSNTYYVVAIATHVEPLLEVRTWETISQDNQGPVGGFRELQNLDPVHKLINQSGYHYSLDNDEDDDPSDEQIQAAINKSMNNSFHQPLILKDANKPKPRRRFNRRRSKE